MLERTIIEKIREMKNARYTAPDQFCDLAKICARALWDTQDTELLSLISKKPLEWRNEVYDTLNQANSGELNYSRGIQKMLSALKPWADETTYYTISGVFYQKRFWTVELSKNLSQPLDQDGILQLARKADPQTFRPIPSDLEYAIKEAVYNNRAHPVIKDAVESVRRMLSKSLRLPGENVLLEGRYHWLRGTSIVESRENIDGIFYEITHNAGVPETASFGGERRSSIGRVPEQRGLARKMGTEIVPLGTIFGSTDAERITVILENVGQREPYIMNPITHERQGAEYLIHHGFFEDDNAGFYEGLADRRPALLVRVQELSEKI